MKKKIRIFGFPTHQVEDRTSGVDFYRIIQPLKALNGYEDDEVIFETQLHELTFKMDWVKVAKEFDIIYLNYITDPWGYAAMGAMAKHFNAKIVMDLDDALWYVRSDNPSHDAWQKGKENIKNLSLMIDDVDLVTCTNYYLQNVIIANTQKKYPQVKVIDNYIDIKDTWKNKPEFKDTKDIRISHHGSTTHFEDLSSEEFAKGLDKIMKENPHVTVEFIGAFLPKYKERWGRRYIDTFGHRDIYEWAGKRYPELMSQVDIVVAPLQDNIYTRCKSGIKYLENSAMGKPGVYENMNQYRQYVEQGVNGYVVDTAEEWYNSLKELVESKEKRQKMGDAAYITIQEQTIQKNVWRYAKVFKELLDNNKK